MRRTGQTGKGKQNSTSNGISRTNLIKEPADKEIDTTKAHFTLRIISDVDKSVRKHSKKLTFFIFCCSTGRIDREKRHRKK